MTEVIKYLRKSLVTGIESKQDTANKIGILLEELETSVDLDYQRFFISLAIDLRSELISPQSIWKIIESVNVTMGASDFLRQFDKIITSNLAKYYQSSSCSDDDFGKDEYSVLLYWSKVFLKYRNAKNQSSLPVSWSEEDFAYRSFFYEKTKGLENITDWAGWKGITWVLPLLNLLDNLNKRKELQLTINEIIDKTGLNPPNSSPSKILPNDELLYIEYPKDFTALCFQPSVLSGFWFNKGGLYLSFPKQDGYGRTFSNSAKAHNSKERVHTWARFDHSKFKLNSIGQPNDLLKRKLSKKIISQALIRYEKCN